jgi:class 3 adenylate cyclase/subtilisin family serine protease
MPETRKLAILFADVVGFTRLAGADEQETLARMRTLNRDLLAPSIARHRGRTIRDVGDGVLVVFPSVDDAVQYAVEIQTAMAERNAGVPARRRIEYRMGISSGEVVEEPRGNLRGAVVNVAARLGSIAEPGAIYVSAPAFDQVRGRFAPFVDMGEKRLQGIARPMRVYSVRAGPQGVAQALSAPSGSIGASRMGQSAVAGIDPYLIHSFETDTYEGVGEKGADRWPVLPMLVRVTNPGAIKLLENAEDCSVTSSMGNIVACLGSIRTIHALEKESSVVSIEASRPSSGHDCSVSVPFVRANRVQNDPQQPEKGDRGLVAVIDGGIDVLHEAFRDSNGRTRIISIWDQTDATGPAPTIQGRQLYGTLHSASDIDGYIAAGSVPQGLGRDREHHGTHVTSIAAGRATSKFSGGVAPEAKILVVIPRLSVNRSDPWSIGYSISHLDALSYIAGEATRLGMPVVVNVSQGMNAGAHDGTSNLEAAFDNFSEGGRLPGRVIVKSAGNERGFAGHSQLALGTNGTDEVKWTSSTPHSGPDIVELWFAACDDLRFRLVDFTNNETSPWVEAGESRDGFFNSGYRYSISFEKFHWDNGDSRLLVSVARGRQRWIGIGDWELEIVARTVQSRGTVHAWLERDNTRPIRFTKHQWEEVTLSIPGTARTVIAVASVTPAMPVRVAADSSYGPTRDKRDKPDLAAPGVAICAAQAGTSDDVESMSGTSMAAPHVSGAIALLLSAREKRIQANPPANLKQLNTAQIRAALGQTSQNYNGRFTSSVGYGVLDVERLLKAFG